MIADGCTVYQKIGPVSPCRLRREFLGFLDYASGVLQGIDFVEGRQVDGKNAWPHKLAEPCGYAFTAFMAGGMEGYFAALRQIDHCVKEGCAKLLILESVRRRIHGLLVIREQRRIIFDYLCLFCQGFADMFGKHVHTLIGDTVIVPVFALDPFFDQIIHMMGSELARIEVF